MYDVALLDLDGVVYVGGDAVRGAPESLEQARAAGMRLAFVTNNAARPPDVVAAHLVDLGVAAAVDEIITSAQAAARYLADRLPAGARVLVVGTTGLEVALAEQGLTPVSDARGEVEAVVQGYSPDMTWRLLAEGAVAINRGLPWVATNLDPTVPSQRGPLPGNGSLVAALKHATGATPVVTGKPEPAMHRESLLRSGARTPIVVGDRLDTDIEGANAVGCDSLLVLSGVTTPRDLIAAPPQLRPTHLGWDVGALLFAHPRVQLIGDAARCGPWTAREAADATMSLSWEPVDPGAGASPSAQADQHLDALRALCAARWTSDPSDEPVTTGDRRVRVVADPNTDAAARQAVEQAIMAVGLA
jgi:HAD superfamily hydrolase (TIGR01450 family)